MADAKQKVCLALYGQITLAQLQMLYGRKTALRYSNLEPRPLWLCEEGQGFFGTFVPGLMYLRTRCVPPSVYFD